MQKAHQMNAHVLIEKLQLIPHPEGGWYRETYRSAETMTNKNGLNRNVCSAIYFLLEGNNKSHFHRIQSDEIWFFHSGEPLEILMITSGQVQSITLGNNIINGEIPQFSVQAQTWFAAKIITGTGYSLVSRTVAPGFDFSDFELAKRANLLDQFSVLNEVVKAFTPE